MDDPNIAINVTQLSKAFGKFVALKNIDLTIPRGAICGIIGPNGAGKTTLLRALAGLCDVEGQLDIVGHDPRSNRARLMEDVCFIADVGVLPANLRVVDVIDYVEDVHPKFDRAKAMDFITTTDIDVKKRIKGLSKGMVTQLHLALVMAIDVSVLILDEPTIGLDILYRKDFYDRLLTHFHDSRRTILISTHQVEEIESLLTHLVFLKKGRAVLDASMDSIASRFCEVVVAPEHFSAADALLPIAVREMPGAARYLFETSSAAELTREQLARLGEPRTPAVADLFVALLSSVTNKPAGALA